MSISYGVHLIPDANKNAANVLYALIKGEDTAVSENISQPANPSGAEGDPWTYWFGGKFYTAAELAIFQNLPANIPAATWPVQGMSGAVTLADVEAAAAAFILTVTTRASFDSQQSTDTLAAALGAINLKRVIFGD